MKACCDTIVLGTQYYRQPTPTPREWADDLKKIKALGMQMIQLRPQWCWHERKEGLYAWDDLDRLLELADQAGLAVIFKFMLETAPDFVFKKYGGYRVGLKDERLWPMAHGAFYPGGWLPCFDHPHVMQAATRFVAEAVKRYAGCDTIALWHAWNEPRSRPVGECCCGHSVKQYQGWLRARFGTIEALNDFAGKCWDAFDGVGVPRDTADFTEMHLWRTWAATRVAWRVKEVADTIKRYDGSRPVIAHVGNPSVTQDVMCDTSDDYLTRQSVDMYGTSFEMRWLPKPLERSLPFLQNDWMRSISGDGCYWVNELYPSMGSWAREVPAARVVMWLWASLACGAKGIVFWQYKKERVGCETNDAGLVETDGRDNPTTVALRNAFAIINTHSRLLAAAKAPKPKIALVYDFASDLVNRIEESRHMRDFALSVTYPTCASTYKSNLQFAYHLFCEAGIPVEVVSSHELGRINEYAVAYLPMFLAVDDGQSAMLSAYVKTGGTLIAEGGIAQRETSTMLHTTRPGAGLMELFGAQEVCRIVEDGEDRQVIMADQTTLRSKKINASFALKGGTALAHYEDGAIAMVEKTHGKGKAIMTGFNPGMAYMLSEDEGWIDWMSGLVRGLAGVVAEPYCTPKNGLYARVLDAGDGRIFFLFNLTGKPKMWVLPADGVNLATDGTLKAGETLRIDGGAVAVVSVAGN